MARISEASLEMLWMVNGTRESPHSMMLPSSPTTQTPR